MSIFKSDPRETKDPLLNRSSNTRLLIDLISEGIALSLASATASNYLSDQYGSLHRVIYEKVAKLISEMMIDLSDLSDEASLRETRPEFLNTKLLSLLFEEDKYITYTDTEDLKNKISVILDALVKGSSENNIRAQIQSLVGSKTNARVEQLSEHAVDISLDAYLQTSLTIIDGNTQENGHRHFIHVRGVGLESTGGPISAIWGDDLHTHEIYEGVVQPAYDREGNLHTHDLTSSLSPSLLTISQDLERTFSLIAPAHVSLDKVTNVTKEIIDEPAFGLSLALGSSFQEDMRRAREGTYESTILGYLEGKTARTWSTIFSAPDTLYISALSAPFEKTRKRILSVSESVAPDGEYQITLPRITNRDTGDALTFSSTYTVSNGLIVLPTLTIADGWNEEYAWAEVQDGEPVLLGSVCYFARRIKAPDYLNSNGLTCSLGAIQLEVVEITLDSKYTGEPLCLLYNSSVSYRTRDARYRSFSWVMPALGDVEDPITPISLPATLKRIFNSPITGSDFTLYINDQEASTLVPAGSDLILKWIDLPLPHVRRGLSAYLIDGLGNRSALVSEGDTLNLSYPYGTDQNTTFSALNHLDFKLNSHRYDRIKDSYAGRGLTETRATNTLSSHPQVLNRPSRVEVGIYERREISNSLLSTDMLNTNSVLGMGFTLNNSSISVSIDPKKVFKTARATVTVNDGKINISDLGFYPSKILYVKEGSTYLSYRISGSYIYVDVDDNTELTIEALSNQPFTSVEDWFRNEEYAEGQVPFVNKAFDPTDYPDVPSPDDYLANPEGRPLANDAQDEARRITGTVFEESRGSVGELIFAEDNLLDLSFSGDAYTEGSSPIRDVSHSSLLEITASAHNTNPMIEQIFQPCFICSGENDGVLYDVSLLNDDLSILAQTQNSATEQVQIYLIP